MFVFLNWHQRLSLLDQCCSGPKLGSVADWASGNVEDSQKGCMELITAWETFRGAFKPSPVFSQKDLWSSVRVIFGVLSYLPDLRTSPSTLHPAVKPVLVDPNVVHMRMLETELFRELLWPHGSYYCSDVHQEVSFKFRALNPGPIHVILTFFLIICVIISPLDAPVGTDCRLSHRKQWKC